MSHHHLVEVLCQVSKWNIMSSKQDHRPSGARTHTSWNPEVSIIPVVLLYVTFNPNF